MSRVVGTMVIIMNRIVHLLRCTFRKPDHRIIKLITHYKKIDPHVTWVNLFGNELRWYYLNNGDRFKRFKLYSKLNESRGVVLEPHLFFSLQDPNDVHMAWNLMTTADKYGFYQEHIRSCRY
jgi:hypothetical protein